MLKKRSTTLSTMAAFLPWPFKGDVYSPDSISTHPPSSSVCVYIYRHLYVCISSHKILQQQKPIYFHLKLKMAPATQLSVPSTGETDLTQAPNKRATVKTLVESVGTTSVPTGYSYSKTDKSAVLEPEHSIPVIDYSLLTSADPDQRSKGIQDLGKACDEWGFFLLVNHPVPASLMKAVLDGCAEFFDMPDEEKRRFVAKDSWDPVKFGTGVDIRIENYFLWRDYLKCYVHPQFHFFDKPKGFSEVAREYSEKTREVERELFRGISESLGLEANYIEKAMNLESGLQIFASSFYPPCPQPENAIGLPPHSDLGLLTILIQNDVGGLQVLHNGKWISVNPLPNCLMVHTADNLEMLTNGKCKSGLHQAVVNNKSKRISIAMGHGPSLDTIVKPGPEFVDEDHPAAYIPIKFRDFVDLQQVSRLSGKTMLDQVRVQPPV